MKAMLLRSLENHVLFTTSYISLSALYADCTWPHKYKHMHIMNTHISSAVLYHLEHSTLCVSTTVPPPQPFLMSFLKNKSVAIASVQSRSVIQKILHRLHAFSLFHLHFSSLRYISQLHTAVFFPQFSTSSSCFWCVVLPSMGLAKKKKTD